VWRIVAYLPVEHARIARITPACCDEMLRKTRQCTNTRDRLQTGGQGVPGSNPGIPTNFYRIKGPGRRSGLWFLGPLWVQTVAGKL